MDEGPIKNRCPLCGKELEAGEEFCGSCREIAETSYPSELLTFYPEKAEKEDVEEYIEEETPVRISSVAQDELKEKDSFVVKPKSNRKLTVFVLVGALVLVLVGGIGSYVLVQNKNAEETQDNYWGECVKENTPLSYSKYLVQYPDGKYSDQAQGKIVELREKEKQEWNQLRAAGNEDALLAFLRECPDSPYATNARHMVDSLAWEASEKANTKEGYLSYLQKSLSGTYNGDHVDVAQQRYDYFNQLKPVTGEELSTIKKVLDNFFKAISSVDTKAIPKFCVPVLDHFIGLQQQAAVEISDSIKSNLKNNKFRKISYTPTFLEVIQDNKGLYLVTLTADIETTFIDRKKKKENKSQTFNIVLNAERLMQSIEVK